MLELFDISVLIPWVLGVVIGIVVGSTPGLTATMAVALAVPFSFHFSNPLGGLALILGLSFSAIFAGDLPATFLKIPGTPASAAATLDSYQLHQNGKGGVAIHLNLLCSCIGGLFGVAVVALSGPWIAHHSLKMDSPEYFWMAIVGLMICIVVSGKKKLHGVLAGVFGVLLSTVGFDMINGAQRFTFNSPELQDGLELIPMMIGLFGFSEILQRLSRHSQNDFSKWSTFSLQQSLSSSFKITFKHLFGIIRGSSLGTLVGALPGAGADIGAWIGYGAAKKFDKNREQIGQGAYEGVIGPTSANNAAVAGAWIPALVFGIPGDAVTAIILGALIMYDIQPGPEVFSSADNRMVSLLWIAAGTQIILFLIGLLGIRFYSLLLRIPSRFLESLILVFCLVGSYAIRNSVFDMFVMVAFGLIGLFMNRNFIAIPPLILGFILGPVMEKELRSGLISSSGSWKPFLTSPFFSIILVSFVGYSIYKIRFKKSIQLSRHNQAK